MSEKQFRVSVFGQAGCLFHIILPAMAALNLQKALEQPDPPITINWCDPCTGSFVRLNLANISVLHTAPVVESVSEDLPK